VLGREQPRIDDGEVGWDDGEEEEEDSYDLRDVQAVVNLEKVCQNRQCNKGGADDDAGYSLCPGLVIIGKHLGTPFFVLSSGVVIQPVV
jgi:hypothetical protein